jgi:LysR family hydrogen peroxide-inducible transcriptional activator
LPTITQLNYILAVQKFGHFGKASEACNVSQPSLSMQIQKVEDELGIVIFDRATKPVTPTQKGQKVIQAAERVIYAHNDLLKVSQGESEILKGDFHLGVIPTIGPYLIPLFVESFSKKYEHVNLTIEELKTEDIVDHLQQGKIDAGLLATPLNIPNTTEDVLFYEPFYIYAHSSHPILKKKIIKAKDIENLHEIWLLKDGHCFRNQFLKLCASQEVDGVFPNIKFESGNLETLRYLIKSSRGVTLLPQLFIQSLPPKERQNMVRHIESPTPMREVSLLSRKNLWKLDILKALRTTIEESLPKGVTDKTGKKAQVIGIQL